MIFDPISVAHSISNQDMPVSKIDSTGDFKSPCLNNQNRQSIESGELTTSYSPIAAPCSGRIDRYRTLAIRCTYKGCYEKMSNLEELPKHLLLCHRKFVYSCTRTNCGRHFKYRNQLADHLTDDHHNEQSPQCFKCSQMFWNPEQEIKHFFLHHFPGVFACAKDGCGFKNMYRAPILDHYYKYHEQSQLPSPRCQSEPQGLRKRKNTFKKDSTPRSLVSEERQMKRSNRGPARFRFSRDSDGSYGF